MQEEFRPHSAIERADADRSGDESDENPRHRAITDWDRPLAGFQKMASECRLRLGEFSAIPPVENIGDELPGCAAI